MYVAFKKVEEETIVRLANVDDLQVMKFLAGDEGVTFLYSNEFV